MVLQETTTIPVSAATTGLKKEEGLHQDDESDQYLQVDLTSHRFHILRGCHGRNLSLRWLDSLTYRKR